MTTIADAFDNGYRLHAGGRLAEAEAVYRHILAQQPAHVDALHLLGVIAHQVGQHAAGADLMRQAIALSPQTADIYNNLALALDALGTLEQSRVAAETAIRLRPAYPEAYNTLGNVFVRLGETDRAIAAYDAAIRQNPVYAEAHCNRGIAHKDAGALDAALEDFRTALRLRPQFPKAHSHLIFTLHYHPATTVASLGAELRAWGKRFAAPLRAEMLTHRNSRDPNRRLRIGYVSPDLRLHAVGRYLLPLMREHNRSRFEVVCYSDVSLPDAFTRRLQQYAAKWHDTAPLSDSVLAARIREDQIDILIDLTLHTGRNRLLLFARKPAPVQVTYLAYCGSSGLETMDYRLTDPHFDPVGSDESAYSERSVRLPETYWCYEPVEEDLEVSRLPALDKGRVTFGCLNNFCKITPPTIQAWAAILRSVPRSELIVHAKEGQHRQVFTENLMRMGVTSDRISFVGKLPLREYVTRYRCIDIALDPFPYGGGTTTCDALWMGVPVITLEGQLAISRAGTSILRNIALTKLIAKSGEEYVKLAVALASDFGILDGLRNTLRERMRDSPVMNAPRFVQHLESAYRSMWRQWCHDSKDRTAIT